MRALPLALLLASCHRAPAGQLHFHWDFDGQSCDRAGILWVRIEVSGLAGKRWPCRDDRDQMGGVVDRVGVGVHSAHLVGLGLEDRPLYEATRDGLDVSEGQATDVTVTLARTSTPNVIPELKPSVPDVPPPDVPP